MSTENITKKEYLDLIQSEEYTNLYHYYMQDTYLDILGVARQENHHSDFIRWLLDPAGSHGLGDFPLRKMIQTLLLAKEKLNNGRFTGKNESGNQAANTELVNLCFPNAEQNLLDILLFGNYTLSNVKVFRELYLSKQSRIDIFAAFKVNCENDSYPCILVIENKIKSAEHGNQTKNYFEDISSAVQAKSNNTGTLWNVLKNQCSFPLEDKDFPKIYAFFVYLTADQSSLIKDEIQKEISKEKSLCPSSNAFLWLNYQYLLDGVLEPCLHHGTTDLTKQRISEYIRCLGQDSKLGNDALTAKAAKNTKDEYCIMAVSSQEKQWAMDLRAKHESLIAEIFTSLAKEPNPFGAKEEKFWSCVANLYLIILENKDSLTDLSRSVVKVRSSGKKEFKFQNKTYHTKERENNLGRLCHDLIQWIICQPDGIRWDEKKIKNFRENLWKKGMTNWLLDILLFEDEKGKLLSGNTPLIAVDDPRQLRKYHIDNKEDLKTHFFSMDSDAIKIGSTSFFVARYWTYSDYQILREELDKIGYKDILKKEIEEITLV